MYTIHLDLKSFEKDNLKKTENCILSLFEFLNTNQIKYKTNPKKCKKITVLRSPHIDKKSREHFQLLTFKRTLSVSLSDRNSVFFVFEILKNMKSIGVEISMTVDFLTY
jgi:ribosomal protein S10